MRDANLELKQEKNKGRTAAARWLAVGHHLAAEHFRHAEQSGAEQQQTGGLGRCSNVHCNRRRGVAVRVAGDAGISRLASRGAVALRSRVVVDVVIHTTRDE